MTEHSCECGAHDGPVTIAQRERLKHCSRLVDDWLAAVLSGVHHQHAAALAPIHGLLRLAPTLHDAHVRLVGLTTLAARRCGELLPRPRGSHRRDGYWFISTDDGYAVDDEPAHVRLALRLVTAYGNGDDDAANDVLLAHLSQLECADIQHELLRTFMYLSNVYLSIDDAVREQGRTGLRSRLAAAWRRGA